MLWLVVGGVVSAGSCSRFYTSTIAERRNHGAVPISAFPRSNIVRSEQQQSLGQKCTDAVKSHGGTPRSILYYFFTVGHHGP
jgi:hypothetical protein